MSHPIYQLCLLNVYYMPYLCIYIYKYTFVSLFIQFFQANNINSCFIMSNKETIVAPSHSIPRWWSKETVAIVTGANKGIGYALVKQLAELGLTVILTARNSARGLEAVESLKREGLHVHFFCLDISDHSSIKTFVSWFQQAFGVLDILINNAAVSFNNIYENSVEHAETVIATNFYGTKTLTHTLLPLFRRSSTVARILNLSSRLGLLDKLKNPQFKRMLADEENLSETKIEGMVNLFLEDVKKGTWKSRGWPKVWTDYAVSKLALNAYSRLLAKRYKGINGISVNCFCPGFTQTSMTGGKGINTANDVAEVGARLALLPPEDLPTGKFYVVESSSAIYSKL